MTGTPPAASRSKQHRLGKGDAEANASAQPAKSMARALSDKANKPADRISPKAGSEKRLSLSRNPGLQQEYEDLAKLRNQLATVEMEKEKASEELANMKIQSEELSNKLNLAIAAANREKIRAGEMEQASFTAAEDWQAELEGMKKRYDTEVVDLKATKSAVENLKLELLDSIQAKSEAVKLAAETMNAAEATAKRADELSAEITAVKDSIAAMEAGAANVDNLITDLSAVKEALSEAYATSEKTASEGAGAVAAKADALERLLEDANQLEAENKSLKQELFLASNLQIELCNMYDAIRNLKDELVAAKEARQKESLAAAEVYLLLENTKSDIELSKKNSKEAHVSFVSLSRELKEVQQGLGSSLSETATLAMKLESVKLEMERNEIELEEMREREAQATVEVITLTEKLANARFQLSQALAAEREAEESFKSLTASLQEFVKDTEETRQKIFVAQSESQRRQQERAAIEAEVEIVRLQVQNSREVINKLDAEAKAAFLEAEEAKENAEADRVKLQAAKEEIEVAKFETEAARSEIEVANNQILTAQKDAQIAQLKIQEADAEVQAEMEQARAAKEESEQVFSRVSHLKLELERVQLDTEKALTVKSEAESRLKDALRVIEEEKVISESCDQGRKTEHSEAWWETAESLPAGMTISVEEYDSLKTNLQDLGVFETTLMAEVDAATFSEEELSRKLEDANKEAEASKQVALHVHQQVEEAQVENLALEDELQKLRMDIKHLEEAKQLVNKESFDLGINGTVTTLSSEDKALHLENSLHQTLRLDLSAFHAEEDSNVEETPSSSIKKKKKKALLLRIGSYLTKIRNQEMQ